MTIFSRLIFADSTPRRLGLNFACVLAARAQFTRHRARLPANGREPLAERLACPKTPRDRLRHRCARPIRASLRQQSFVTCKIDWTETAESCHGREKHRARPQQFSADSWQAKTTALPGAEKLDFLFSSSSRPPSPHHSPLARPTPRRQLGRERKSRQRRPFTPATVTLSASAKHLMRFRARRAVSRSGEASGKRQGDGQRFQKKMKTKISIGEAAAPASVRPSSVSIKEGL